MTVKYKGVTKIIGTNRWRSVYCSRYLGCFSTPQEAAVAYDEACRHDGRFQGRINFPERFPAMADAAKPKRVMRPFRANHSGSDFDGYVCLLLSRTRGVSEKSGRVFDITLDDIKDLYEAQQGLCVYTGDIMTVSHQGESPFALSVDRIDSNIGYIRGNIQLTCVRINRAKSSMSHRDFVAMCSTVAQHCTAR